MRFRILAVTGAAMLLISLALVQPERTAGARTLRANDRPTISSFDPAAADEVTKDIRDPNKSLVRIDVASPADRERAAQSGRLVQDFGKFVVVVRDRGERRLASGEHELESEIFLPGARFDPIAEERPETVAAGDPSGTRGGYYIVQFGGLVVDEWLDDLRDAGLELLQYVPNHAYLVYGDGLAASRAASHSRVRWVGSFRAEHKISSVLRDQIESAKGSLILDTTISPISASKQGMATFDVAVFSRARLDAVAAQIAAFYGGKKARLVELPNNFFNVVRLELPIDRAELVADIPDVIRIDAYGKPEAEDERAAQIVAGNYSSTTVIDGPGYDPLSQFGVDGTGVTVSMVDDGVSIPGNGGFYITSANTVHGPLHGAAGAATGGHGHLNASIISGYTPFGPLDPLSYNYGVGIAPRSNIVNIPLLVGAYSGDEADSANDTVVTTGVNGVRASISNNSWGNGLNSNSYDSYASQFDGYARDASFAGTIDPLLLVFSAGNSGPGSGTLTRPKAAKNLIAVGNSENIRTELGGANANNMDDLRSSSSRGPTADGRIKPDVVAPGTYITGSRAGSCGSVSSCFDANHAYSIGTSHAAPQVAGAAALFTEYWKNTHFGQNPSPAMVKAAIINSGQEMAGVTTNTATIPNGIEGWGRVNIKNILGAPFPVLQLDQSVSFFDVGDDLVLNGTVIDASRPVRASLVWTDPPAIGDPALVNNLDLTVIVGANTYRGNVFSGGVSTTGGSSNTNDNVENVFLPAGISAGTAVSITVTAAALNGNGILGNADPTDQDFALVLYNFALTPTSAGAEISGRITDAFGQGMTRVLVQLTAEDGSVVATAFTNTFGYYRIPNVPTGLPYLITPRHKRYVFSPEYLLHLHLDDIAGLDFTAAEP